MCDAAIVYFFYWGLNYFKKMTENDTERFKHHKFETSEFSIIFKTLPESVTKEVLYDRITRVI